jgi:hypothetical protein
LNGSLHDGSYLFGSYGTGEQIDAAEESYRRALDIAHGQIAKLWEVKGATSLARL